MTKVAGVPCYVSRTGFGGELGFELFCAPEHAADLWDVAVSRMHARPFGVGVLESLRVEAGLIVLDYDYTAHERTPYDLSLDRMVALGVVDFLGSDALVEVAANPPRRLKTLRFDGEELPDYGVGVTKDGEEVGTLTSPAVSRALARWPSRSSNRPWRSMARGSRSSSRTGPGRRPSPPSRSTTRKNAARA